MLKTQRRYSMALVLARLLQAALTTTEPLPSGLLVIPIPASRASLRQRGFNPAAEIAAALCAELALPLARGILRRRRESVRQTTLGRTARLQAGIGLFHCVTPLTGRHVALVDDVMTTGSTIDAAAEAVLAAGALSVTALVVARTP
jgi:predicted amidophosphoribosyltransferase